MKQLTQTNDYLLLVDEEAEIKENQIFIHPNNALEKASRDLDGRGLSKILAYYPLTKEAKELDLPLLPNPFEKFDIEKLALKELGYENDLDITNEAWEDVNTFIRGYKAAQQAKQFTLEDMKISFHKGRLYQGREGDTTFESFIQSLSPQQIPKEFIPEYINANSYGSETNGYDSGNFIPKTIINSEGKQELVGVYKY